MTTPEDSLRLKGLLFDPEDHDDDREDEGEAMGIDDDTAGGSSLGPRLGKAEQTLARHAERMKAVERHGHRNAQYLTLLLAEREKWPREIEAVATLAETIRRECDDRLARATEAATDKATALQTVLDHRLGRVEERELNARKAMEDLHRQDVKALERKVESLSKELAEVQTAGRKFVLKATAIGAAGLVILYVVLDKLDLGFLTRAVP